MNRLQEKGLLACCVVSLMCGTLVAATNSYVGSSGGDWNEPTNWSLGRVPTTGDDVEIDGLSVTCNISASVASVKLLNAAELFVGDKDTRNAATLTTSGDLTVKGGSKLTVYADTLADRSVFSNLETDIAPIASALWNAAKIVTVGGNLTVEDTGSTVYPDADKVTGVPVFFKVGGDFTLGEGASFDAVERGWGWTVGQDYPDDYAKPNLTLYKFYAWSYAPGCGNGFNLGGGYGGSGTVPKSENGKKYAYTYGTSFAPFLPGSNSGWHFVASANIDYCRGGGAIVVFTTGKATIAGTVNASSNKRDSSGASGGGIWLTAESFEFGATALLDAHGGSGYNYSGQGAGGGGRIALAEGYSWADVETAAGGTVPAGFIDAGTIRDFEVATDVAGGLYTAADKKYEPFPGTLSYVRSTTTQVRIVVSIDGLGSVTCGDTVHTEPFELTVDPNVPLTFTATPGSDAAFISWFGDVLPDGMATTASLTLTPTVPFALRAAFASTVATARTWTGAKSSDWFDGANWSPTGLPGPNDAVTLSGAAVKLDGSVSVGSLLLTSSAALTVGDYTSRNGATVTTSGDLTVEGGSKLTVYAGTLADLSVYSTLETDIAPIAAALWNAAKVVTVGGNLTVKDAGSTVYPDADKVSGVPVIFKVAGDFTLGEGASFNAVERGWGWTKGATGESAPQYAKTNIGNVTPAWSFAPGSGYSYTVGGGYGGQSPKAGVSNKVKYGYAYGYACAPFLPGSNGSLYRKTLASEYDMTRGGGAVVVFAAGDATVSGSVNVSSEYRDHAGASGGGIWLMAKTFTFGANALLDAHGGATAGYQAQGLGGGGRIALAEGYTWSDAATAATGVVPTGFTDAGTILATEVATDVAGGKYTGTGAKYDPYPGTLSYVRSSSKPVNLRVVIDGNGSVTYDGTPHTETFDVMVPVQQALNLTATPATGAQFISWGGSSIPGGVCETPNLTLTLEAPAEITVTFVDGVVERTWVGGKDGSWTVPLNWLPAGVPRATDAVVIRTGLVRTDGNLTVGALTLAGSAVLSNAAVAVEGDSSAANLAAGATVIAVAGALRLEDTATLIPANEPVTGAPVRYEVGSLSVAEGASIDATGRGWQWYASADDPLATLTQGAYQTRAPGAGGDDNKAAAYNRGGAYGALGGNAQMPYGQPYGSAYAPLLPGSPNGLYDFLIKNMNLPGGTVWVKCAGLMELYGTIACDGKSIEMYGAASGGGVWLCAKGIKAGSAARVTANGGYLKSSGYASYGSGGRIALALGLTDAQQAALIAGTDPTELGLSVEDGVSLFTATARGGERAGVTPTYGNDGTVKTLIGPEAYINVVIAGSPVAALGTEPALGTLAFEKGSVQTFNAPEYGVDPADSAVRYACSGYVVTDAEGEVARGEGRTASVTITGPLTVTWQWGVAEKRTLARKPEHGSLTVDGTPVDGDAIGWTTGRTAAIGAVPDDGYEFVCWEGVLPLGHATQNPLVADLTKPLDMTPVFRAAEAPTTRTWNGTGDWKDATKWSPAGNIPGVGDTVVIAGGTCTVSNALVAAALQVTGGTLDVGRTAVEGCAEILVAGDVTLSGGTVNLGAGARTNDKGVVSPQMLWKGHGRFSAANLTLSGSATLAVMGGPVEGAYTFATGCSFVEVDETLTLADTSVLALYSEILSGGSVKVAAKTVTVAEGATVDASAKGFMWLDNDTPPDVPGIGYSYSIGASHGGVGGRDDPLSQPRPTYGFPLSPVMPGAPNGNYSGTRPGGGLIRIHAEEMTVNGTLDARAWLSNTFGGASGGGIWLTAKTYAFGANAVLTARGGRTGASYRSHGGGGRIAICRNMNDDQLASLAETGTWPTYRARKWQTLEAFRELFQNDTMTVDVHWGGDSLDEYTAKLPAAQKRLDDAKAAAAEPGLTPEQKKAADTEVTNAQAALNALNADIANEPASHGTFAYVDGTISGMTIIVR